ncbi:aarF domain-containing kinase 1 [Drosophila nasuta]|uniref:aarF domain-containing kinase 1 n=1 Tax=Drosophila nasuta TaxID=42062 RepID=UPI00295F3D60|nr:aarF domain-containing kinase 1 [Drosophila nasuta]XP_060658589.1 aarF domain-containing kinase 1 [Drosophila nasuta]XP_060658591.1 aarF domain-containing kinase 1 [Drosophila nasuta]XP_060658592.1 aarF domain-containing kinase 1 [Drosophila nasuta]
MLRRVLAFGALGAGVVSTALSLHTNDYDLNSLGIVRLSRSACAVVDVALTYKQELYYREWDKTTPEYKAEKSRVHKIAADKLLQLICINKGVYIKVGQHIGALEYLLPKEFVQTMKVLHSDAPQNPIEDLYKVIRQDLKREPTELFESFEPEPLGTASLAQVHKARLKTGEVVAVKVQHPYVKGNSRVDMKTMEMAVRILGRIFPDFKIQWLVEESKKNLPVELDFLNEGKNAEKVAGQFKKYSWLRVPKIYWELSTPRVLVMEYLEGGHVTDLDYIKRNKIDAFEVANKIGRLYSEMIFSTGFVHSDPHPGNILVRQTPKNDLEIVLLDHGLYANLTDKFRYEYSKLWLSIMKIDRKAMRKHSEQLGITRDLYGLFACMVTGRPWETLMQGITKVKYSKEEKNTLQSNTSQVLPHISDVLEQVDRQMLLILKTNDLIRSIESTLRTQNRMTAFWAMTKCCVQSTYAEQRAQETTKSKRWRLELSERWELFKLNVYYLFLGLKAALKQVL